MTDLYIEACCIMNCLLYTDQRVDGETFSTLPTDRNELQTELGCTLTLGGKRMLCRLIKATQEPDKGIILCL